MKSKHKQAYMECAEAFSKCSPATRLQVGSVIVKDNRIISCGYNALPEHIQGSCELPDGTTDPRVRHSERNALLGLTKSNVSSQNSIMFCTHACCSICAIDIVDAGITEFYFRDYYRDDAGLLYLMNNSVAVYKSYIEVGETQWARL